MRHSITLQLGCRTYRDKFGYQILCAEEVWNLMGRFHEPSKILVTVSTRKPTSKGWMMVHRVQQYDVVIDGTMPRALHLYAGRTLDHFKIKVGDTFWIKIEAR